MTNEGLLRSLVGMATVWMLGTSPVQVGTGDSRPAGTVIDSRDGEVHP